MANNLNNGEGTVRNNNYVEDLNEFLNHLSAIRPRNMAANRRNNNSNNNNNNNNNNNSSYIENETNYAQEQANYEAQLEQAQQEFLAENQVDPENVSNSNQEGGMRRRKSGTKSRRKHRKSARKSRINRKLSRRRR